MILLEIRVGSNCTSNDNCLALGNAVCSPATGTCRCNRAHFASPIGTKCIPGNINVTDDIFVNIMVSDVVHLMLLELGESCQKKGEESYIEKSFCREGTWSCANGTVASNNNRECLKGDFDKQIYGIQYSFNCIFKILKQAFLSFQMYLPSQIYLDLR